MVRPHPRQPPTGAIYCTSIYLQRSQKFTLEGFKQKRDLSWPPPTVAVNETQHLHICEILLGISYVCIYLPTAVASVLRQDPAATTARDGFLPAPTPCCEIFRWLDRRSFLFSRYAATDDLLDAPADALLDAPAAPPAPMATEGLLPDLTAIDGLWVSAAIAREGFLCDPGAPAAVALMLIADDGFLAAFMVEADRVLESSPEDGRPWAKKMIGRMVGRVRSARARRKAKLRGRSIRKRNCGGSRACSRDIHTSIGEMRGFGILDLGLVLPSRAAGRVFSGWVDLPLDRSGRGEEPLQSKSRRLDPPPPPPPPTGLSTRNQRRQQEFPHHSRTRPRFRRLARTRHRRRRCVHEGRTARPEFPSLHRARAGGNHTARRRA